jgi:hypothetical protein
MLASNMLEFRNLLKNEGVVFCYSGYITEPVLAGIGEALKQKLVLESADKKTMRNVFAIFVEEMQNIIRYSAEREPVNEYDENTDLRYGVLNIGMEQQKFYVKCGNMVMKDDVDRLSQKLRDLQRLDEAAIKRLYKDKLREPVEATSKGAGVGFIEIARRSSEIIDFDFLDVDDSHSFFCLKAYV